MSNSKRVAGKLFGGALLAGAMFGFSASNADASLMLDLQVQAGAGVTDNGKTVTVTQAGGTFTVDVYAKITSTAASNSFQSAFYNILTDTKPNGVKISLGDFTMPTAFQGNGYQLGGKYDLDGDGTIDVIGDKTDGSKATDFVYSRSPDYIAGDTTKIGSFTFTVSAVDKVNGAINIQGRKKSSPVPPAAWKEGTQSGTIASQQRADAGGPIQIVFDSGTQPGGKHLGWNKNAAGTNGKVKVKANPNGYLSEVMDVTGNKSKGDVAFDVTGNGPAGSAFAMLWVTGDVAGIKSELAAAGTKFVDSGALFDQLHGANSLYTKLAGKPFDLLAQFDSASKGGIIGGIEWDFGTAGTLDKVACVPEPASLTVLGLGAAALMMARRRRA